MLGNLFSFFIQKPELLPLIGDWRSMWLLWAAGPIPIHVPILLYVCNSNSAFYSPREVLQRFPGMRSLSFHAAIGVLILVLPTLLIFLALSDGFFGFLLFLLSLSIAGMIVLSAQKNGVPRLPVGAAVGLVLGVTTGLVSHDDQPQNFHCRFSILQLRSGDALACERLSLLRDRSLWLVEGPPEPRLVGKSDVDWEMVGIAER